MNEILTKNLKIVRSYMGLSQAGMAEVLGVSVNTYTNYETGKRVPPADFLSRLINACQNLNGHWLLTGIEPMFISNNIMGKNPDALDNLKNWGERLSQYMSDNNLTSEKLSRYTGINSSRIDCFIAKSTMPVLDEINKLKSGVNAPIDKLLYGDGNSSLSAQNVNLSSEDILILKKLARRFGNDL